MPTREQLTNERLDALIDLLEQAGVIDGDLSESLSNTRRLGEAKELPEQAQVNDTSTPGRVEGGDAG